MATRLLLIGMLALGVGPSRVQEIATDLPRGFASKAAAVAAGCRFAAVNGPSTETCVVTSVDADPMNVGIYRRGPEGAFARSAHLLIPSWSWSAKVSLVDVLGAGTDWFVVETEGVHGTGIGQRILLVMAWDGSRFRSVAAETLSYRCSKPTAPANIILTVGHAFTNGQGASELQLTYELTRDGNRIGAWTDALQWSANQFAFLPSRSTASRSSPPVDAIRQRIEHTREYSARQPFDPEKNSETWMRDSGLMDVLDPVCN